MASAPMLRDFRALRRLALEVARQCDHYERNTAAGHDDEFRATAVGPCWVARMDRTARRMERRYQRARAKR